MVQFWIPLPVMVVLSFYRQESYKMPVLHQPTCLYVNAFDDIYGCSSQMANNITLTVLGNISNSISMLIGNACAGVAPDQIEGSIPVGGDGNYFYLWKSSINGGQSWTDALGVNDGQNYSPDVLPVDTWYKRIVTSGPCSSESNIVTVNVYSPPAAVTVSAPAGGLFCGSTTLTAKNTTTGIEDGTIYFQGATSGGTRIDLGRSPQVVNSSGRYYFRAFNNTGCWGQEGFIDVTLSLAPSTIGTSICQTGSGALISASSMSDRYFNYFQLSFIMDLTITVLAQLHGVLLEM